MKGLFISFTYLCIFVFTQVPSNIAYNLCMSMRQHWDVMCLKYHSTWASSTLIILFLKCRRFGIFFLFKIFKNKFHGIFGNISFVEMKFSISKEKTIRRKFFVHPLQRYKKWLEVAFCVKFTHK
jgi:hypothetical protein